MIKPVTHKNLANNNFWPNLRLNLLNPRKIGLALSMSALWSLIVERKKQGQESLPDHDHTFNNLLTGVLATASTIFLDALLPHLGKNLQFRASPEWRAAGGNIGKFVSSVFTPNIVALILGTASLVGIVDGLASKAAEGVDPKRAGVIDLLGTISKIPVIIGFARLLSGQRGSMLSLLTNFSCPCCALPFCGVELANITKSLGDLMVKSFKHQDLGEMYFKEGSKNPGNSGG